MAGKRPEQEDGQGPPRRSTPSFFSLDKLTPPPKKSNGAGDMGVAKELPEGTKVETQTNPIQRKPRRGEEGYDDGSIWVDEEYYLQTGVSKCLLHHRQKKPIYELPELMVLAKSPIQKKMNPIASEASSGTSKRKSKRRLRLGSGSEDDTVERDLVEEIKKNALTRNPRIRMSEIQEPILLEQRRFAMPLPEDNLERPQIALSESKEELLFGVQANKYDKQKTVKEAEERREGKLRQSSQKADDLQTKGWDSKEFKGLNLD